MANVRGHARSRRQWWILAALLHSAACGKTPIDAIVFEQDGAPPTTGDACIDGASSAGAGLFRLRAALGGQCLAVGGSTTIGGSPAWLTTMADDCAVAGEIWQLVPDVAGSSAGSFEVRSTTLAVSLDIRMGLTAEGTTAVLFARTSLANQRFFFSSRRDGVFELEPAHVTGHTSCLANSPPSPAIYRCSASAAEQGWQLIPSDCE